MSNQDLDWLTNQQPQRMGSDHSARERALLALLAHTTSRPRGGGLRMSHIFRAPQFGVAAVGGAAAITAALVLSAGSGPGSVVHSRQLHRKTAALTPAAHHSPLLRLADYVGAFDTETGDATLVARTTSNSSGSVTVYDLYADDGQYFFSANEAGLAGQVGAHNNLADGLFAREIAAAKLAATGSVKTAAQNLADAADPTKVVSPDQPANPGADPAKQAAEGQPQTGSLYDNYVWENSQDALIAGSGEPDVRAGVLRILATLPGVTVTSGTADGQQTLVLSAGAQELGGGYTEQLTINATSGVPIQFVGGAPGAAPTAQVDYTVSRVSLANLPTGSGTSTGTGTASSDAGTGTGTASSDAGTSTGTTSSGAGTGTAASGA